MIYRIDGNALSSAFDSVGSEALAAFNLTGDRIFPDVSTLKVMNYNVGGWYYGGGTNVPAEKAAAYLAMQNQIFDEVDADIACLEEYWTYFSGSTRASTAIINPHFEYSHGVNGSNKYFGRCICSKFPITNYVEHYFTDDQNRYYDEATIDVNGKTIHVFVTHLSTSSNPQVRVDEANVVFDYIQSNGITDYLVFGDFNVGVTDPLSEYNLRVFGNFLNAGSALANGGAFGVFETYSRNAQYNDNLAVDNIIASGAFMIDDVDVNMTKVNFQATNGDKIDHIPFYATIVYAEV